MIRLMACILLLHVFVTACAQGNQKEENIELQSQLDTLATKVAKGGIATIEIMHLPLYIETRYRLAPEDIERGFMYKLTIRGFEGGDRELAEVLKSMAVQPREEMGDIRWALIFYDSADARVGAIYVDRFGDSGAIGDNAVSFNKRKLFKWLDGNFSGCFR